MNKEKFLYPGLIFFLWLLAYISFLFIFEKKLGWDEVAYMSVAKGISEDFNFSARAYTIMGLLKHGFPTNLINYPIYASFLALFFKLFGCSIEVAYFSSWLCALGICLLIYFIVNLIVPNNKKFAFYTAISYLFFPGILKNCNSAMMEQFGNFILCFGLFFIFKDLKNKVFNFFTILKLSFFFLILWLYKTLFIGYFFGFFVLMLLLYFPKIINQEIKLPTLPVSIFASYGIFAVLFFLSSKFLFLPVAPMMNFTPDKEAKQIYADFLGGFFNDFPNGLFENIRQFFLSKVSSYFVFPSSYINPQDQFFAFLPFVFVVGICFILFLISILLSISGWKNMNYLQRIFVVFSTSSIIFFNVIFNAIFSTTYENVWRYNVYYLPVYLIFIVIAFSSNYKYIELFIKENKNIYKMILLTLFIFCFIPCSLSMFNTQQILFEGYHLKAKSNADLISNVIGNSNPRFIYLNDGTHTTFINYPVIQIFKDATNEQLIEVNNILPEKIAYLFLKPSDWLFKINEQLILQGKPIINGNYVFVGYDEKTQIVVYKSTTMG